MRNIQRMVAAASLLAVVTAASADTVLRQKEYDLTRAGDPASFSLWKSEHLGTGVDDEGLTAAQFNFTQYKASFGRSSTTSYEDWSPYNMVSIKLSNREDFPVEFRMLVFLYADAGNASNMYSGRLTLKPRESRRFMCHLNPDDGLPYGLAYMRPVLSKQYTNVYSSGSFRNLQTIHHWRISYMGTAPARVDVSDLRLIKRDITFDNMVDRFGQYTDRNWLQKIRSEEDFQTRLSHELEEIDANYTLGELDGTDKLANASPLPGKWRVVTQPSGMKYFQHPSGKLFWALGVSAVHNGVLTPVQGRTNYFESLPASTGRFADCYAVKPTLDGNLLSYSFNSQNLKLKYGDNYRPTWVSHVKKRLKSWGMNTVGMQCIDEFYDGSMPYTVIVYTRNFATRLRTPRMLWGSFPDPYDANYQSWATSSFSSELAKHKGKTNFMGVYVDNELSWGDTTSDKNRFNVPLGIFKAPANQPAKIATVNWLKNKYKTISALNTAWQTNFASFDAILSGTFQPTEFPGEMHMDFRRILGQFTVTYFSKTQAALKAAGNTGLYLGCRYNDWSSDVLYYSDKYVDVHTFNVYRTVPHINWGLLNNLKSPVMFSELGYSVQGEGTFGGPGEVSSQEERSENLREFLAKAHAQPNIIGAILYCYNDQPVTGRYTDYENSGVGLVDVTDTPHYQAVNTIREFARTMYESRG